MSSAFSVNGYDEPTSSSNTILSAYQQQTQYKKLLAKQLMSLNKDDLSLIDDSLVIITEYAVPSLIQLFVKCDTITRLSNYAPRSFHMYLFDYCTSVEQLSAHVIEEVKYYNGSPHFSLLYMGDYMRHDKLLSDYGIRDGSIITLVFYTKFG